MANDRIGIAISRRGEEGVTETFIVRREFADADVTVAQILSAVEAALRAAQYEVSINELVDAWEARPNE